MTRCNNSNEISLKSTVYNQTGQGYIEQFTLYNSMSSHIRRILLAKSTVDARNKNYDRKLDNCRCCKSTCWGFNASERNISNNFIDTLAYDTKHHPADLVKLSLRPKSCRQWHNRCNIRNSERVRIQCDQPHAEELRGTICKNAAPRKLKKFRQLTPINQSQSAELNKRIKSSDQLDSLSDKTDWQYDEQDYSCYQKQVLCRPLERFEGNPTPSESPVGTMSDQSRSSSPQSNICLSSGQSKSHESVKDSEDEQKYAKFIYEITQEIVRGGVYSDNELHQVFKRHIEMNRDTLSTDKMVHEIQELKSSLNMPNDSAADEEIEQLIKAQKSMTICGSKPRKISANKKTQGEEASSMCDLGRKRDGIVQTDSFLSGELLLENCQEPVPVLLSQLCQGNCFANHGTNAVTHRQDFQSRKFPLTGKACRKYLGKHFAASKLSLITEAPSVCSNKRVKLGRRETSTILETLSKASINRINTCMERKGKTTSKGRSSESIGCRTKKGLTSHTKRKKSSNKPVKFIDVIACPNNANCGQCKRIPLEEYLKLSPESDIRLPNTCRSILQKQNLNEKPKTKQKSSNVCRPATVKKCTKKTRRSNVIKHAAKCMKEEGTTVSCDSFQDDETKSEETEKEEAASGSEKRRTSGRKKRKNKCTKNNEMNTDRSGSNGYNDDSFSSVCSSENETSNIVEEDEAGSEDCTQATLSQRRMESHPGL